MKTKPDYTEYKEALGGEVRYYEENGSWRYIHAGGEGTGFKTLEEAQAEVETFINAPKEEE